MHSSLEKRFVIRLTYADGRVGFCCAVRQSSAKSDSVFKPKAAIALFTEQAAKINIEALKKEWQRYLSYKWKNDIQVMPEIDIVPISVSEKIMGQ